MGRKSLFADSRHVVGNGDVGKTRTIIKSVFTNTRHAVGNGDVGKARTLIVFATYCVPICFA